MVDDDEIHLLIMTNMLEDKYDVLVAKSGKEAIDYFFKGIFPDLVLLDVYMPNMDGWEIFNRIKAFSLLKDIPMIFVTSMDDNSTKKRAQDMGAIDYITKPCEPEDVLNRIGLALKQ